MIYCNCSRIWMSRALVPLGLLELGWTPNCYRSSWLILTALNTSKQHDICKEVDLAEESNLTDCNGLLDTLFFCDVSRVGLHNE